MSDSAHVADVTRSRLCWLAISAQIFDWSAVRPRWVISDWVTLSLAARRIPADAVDTAELARAELAVHRPCSTHDTGRVSLRPPPISADDVTTRFCLIPVR